MRDHEIEIDNAVSDNDVASTSGIESLKKDCFFESRQSSACSIDEHLFNASHISTEQSSGSSFSPTVSDLGETYGNGNQLISNGLAVQLNNDNNGNSLNLRSPNLLSPSSTGGVETPRVN